MDDEPVVESWGQSRRRKGGAVAWEQLADLDVDPEDADDAAAPDVTEDLAGGWNGAAAGPRRPPPSSATDAGEIQVRQQTARGSRPLHPLRGRG